MSASQQTRSLMEVNKLYTAQQHHNHTAAARHHAVSSWSVIRAPRKTFSVFNLRSARLSVLAVVAFQLTDLILDPTNSIMSAVLDHRAYSNWRRGFLSTFHRSEQDGLNIVHP